ncbi:MAG: peptidylprolyl isomerase [Acidobacteriota bacterium]|nr:peptidylprolyl isomerase [Acidobacteriota bacterium]
MVPPPGLLHSRWFVLALILGLVSVPTPAASDAPLTASLRMFQDVYEVGTVIRGELTVINPTERWVEYSHGANLASNLELITADGKAISPTRPRRFGAAKAKSIGPGGFIGLTFDAGMLFPRLDKPGDYILRFGPQGAPSQEVKFKLIEAFSPTADYRLLLETAVGPLRIALDTSEAPVAVHNIVNLARSGLYDGAKIPRVEKGVAFKIRGPASARYRIRPQEKTSAALLAGAVLLEASPPGPGAFNMPHLIVLLGPRPEWQGKATVIGHLVGGAETLDKLVARGGGSGLQVISATVEEGPAAGE